ncbi:MAG: zinc-binding dehydrogenase [Deltaproteobacteria bacterium]|nr:MAG: zinc-binding dehydrogenase [Deltaproteobacteria bacterium]
MRALFWDGRVLRLESSRPTPGTDRQFALVRVRLAGICSTDLQIFKGYMGFRGVPGHEFVGEVEEGPKTLVGKRIVGEINFACGKCEFCQRSLGRHCPNRRVMGIVGADGSFAEYVAVPTANLHLVPDNVSDEEAVFTEPLAAAFEILEQIQLSPGDDVLVMGDGKLGMLCAQVLKLTGAGVTVLGKHPEKLSLIKRTGVRTLLLYNWKPRLFDVVVEATGSDSALKLAMSAVRPRGTLVLKSTIAADHTVSLAPLVINEITVIGSRCGLFPPALQALAEKSVLVTPIIEKVYPLNAGIEAVTHAGRAGALKVLLRT